MPFLFMKTLWALLIFHFWYLWHWILIWRQNSLISKHTSYSENSMEDIYGTLFSYLFGNSWWLGTIFLITESIVSRGFPGGTVVKNLPANPWVRKIPWSRKWQPTSVFMPGKFHGQRSLVGYSPWGCRVGHDWATECTSHTHSHTHTHTHTHTVLRVQPSTLWFHVPPCTSRSFLKLEWPRSLTWLRVSSCFISPWYRACYNNRNCLWNSKMPSFSYIRVGPQFSSVAQSSPILCNPVDCSTPGLPVHHQLLGLTQTHVHRIGDAIQPSHPLSSPSPPAFNLSQHQGLF